MLPLLPTPSRFPLPDWKAIHADPAVATLDVAQLDAFWAERGRAWVHLLRDAFGAGYRGYESPYFWLISSQPEASCRRLIQWAEAVRAKVVRAWAIDPTGRLYGKCPILVLHTLELYYEYIATYYPDGEHALSGGMYLNEGYGHFVFTFLDWSQAEATLAHELAHALVAHLPLPAWLNEGIAQLTEDAVTGRDQTRYDEVRETIGTYWTPETIQDLWTGAGFNRQDEGQLQSYHLSKVLTRNLTGDMSRFRAFILEANAADAGESAVRKHFGVSLESLVTDYLGDGTWAPRPTPSPESPSANGSILRSGVPMNCTRRTFQPSAVRTHC